MNKYQKIMNQIHPDEILVNHTRHLMADAVTPKAIRTRKFRRGAIAILTVVLFLSATVTAIASNRLVLTNVNKTAVDQGITMTITDVNIATEEDDVNQREKGEILLTLQDTDGKGRINRYTDIAAFDVRGFKSDGCELKEYDKKTGTATYSLRVYDWPHGGIDYFNKRGKITVQSILTNRNIETVDTGVTLCEIINQNATIGGEMVYGIVTSEKGNTTSYHLQLLTKDETDLAVPAVPWLKITNIGFTAKNHLNIQVMRTGAMRDYNHAELILKKKNGTELQQINQDVHSEVDYHSEFIFEVTEEELKNCTLFAELTDYSKGETVNGKWECIFHK